MSEYSGFGAVGGSVYHFVLPHIGDQKICHNDDLSIIMKRATFPMVLLIPVKICCRKHPFLEHIHLEMRRDIG
jgi:hypothetical protein